jgi:hypothetical protein
MGGHHKDGVLMAMPHADMKPECKAMMTRKEEMV